MRNSGADVRLRHLLESSTNESARHFARGCLSNMEAVLSPTFVPDPRLEPRNAQSHQPHSPHQSQQPPSMAHQSSRAPRSPTLRSVPQLLRPLGSDGTPLCAVCLDKPVNTALTPCFHAGFCNSCAVTISFNRFPCPVRALGHTAPATSVTLCNGALMPTHTMLIVIDCSSSAPDRSAERQSTGCSASICDGLQRAPIVYICLVYVLYHRNAHAMAM